MNCRLFPVLEVCTEVECYAGNNFWRRRQQAKGPQQTATIKRMKSIIPSPPPQSPSWLAASCQLPSLSRSHIHHNILSSRSSQLPLLVHAAITLSHAHAHGRLLRQQISPCHLQRCLHLCHRRRHPVASLLSSPSPGPVIRPASHCRRVTLRMVEKIIGDRRGLNCESRGRERGGLGSDRFFWCAAKNPREILRPQTPQANSTLKKNIAE